MEDKEFSITFDNLNEGLSPLAHIDNRTFIGSGGQASEMQADILSLPGYVQQSPGLANLSNGDQTGVVDQLIRFILDRPTAANTTYAVGTTKLFKLTSTQVETGGSPSWPQTITGMTSGESVIRLKENLFVFYNKASGGDIAAMPLSSEVIDPSWGSTTDQALENALHPSAAKEDILLFGNGRYVGAYIAGTNTLDVQKLDFGEGSEVADIVFHANIWWIAVNYGEGRRGQIYLYDGSALSSQLSDEAAIGNQKIGFLYVHNGILFVAYQDNTSDGYAIGWLNGRSLKPIGYFNGSLPDHRQKTLYKNTILFAADEGIYSTGAVVEQIALQTSKLSDGGYSTLGGIAAPFGTPMIASSNGSSHRIAKFSGYSTDSNWKSVSVDISRDDDLGNVQEIIVFTKPLGDQASAELIIEGNQGQNLSAVSKTYTISGENTTKHTLRDIDLPPAEDIRIVISYLNSNTTQPCQIRKIVVNGNYAEG